MPLLPNSEPTAKLVTTEAVQGTQEFIQLSAEVQAKINEFNRFYSDACHTNAKWVVDAIADKRRRMVYDEGIRLACLLASIARYKVGRDREYTYPLREQATAAMHWILEDPSDGLEGYLRGNSTNYCTELGEAIVRANLGFTNAPPLHVTHHQHDHQVATLVYEQLESILGWATHGVEKHLDELHSSRMQEVETKTLLRSLEITKATDATAAVLCNEKKQKGQVMDQVVESLAERKVNKHMRRAQRALRKNSTAGGQRPTSNAKPNGTDGVSNSGKVTRDASSKHTSNAPPTSILKTTARKKEKGQQKVSFSQATPAPSGRQGTSGQTPTQPSGKPTKTNRSKRNTGTTQNAN